MDFEHRVAASHDALHSRPGLQALTRADRRHVSAAEPRSLTGSVHLDEDLAASEPHSARWDYAIGVGEEVVFVEVHPAGSGANVHEVVAKTRWLIATFGGSPLWEVRRSPLRWVATGTTMATRAPSFARYRRLLAQTGVAQPTGHLRLDG